MYPCMHHCDDMFRVTGIYCSHSHPSLRTSYVTVAEVLLYLLNDYSWGLPGPQAFPSRGAEIFVILDGREMP
jgi:hypothetical protein